MATKKTFEENMLRLEAIVAQLEKGEAPLDESLKLFEEGTGLVRSCGKLLDEAELQVKKVMVGPGGAPLEGDFNDEE